MLFVTVLGVLVGSSNGTAKEARRWSCLPPEAGFLPGNVGETF